MKNLLAALCIIVMALSVSCSRQEVSAENPADVAVVEEVTDTVVEEEVEQVLMDRIDEILKELESLNQLQNFTITHQGNVITETYFNSGNAEKTSNIYSDTKSVTSLLVGIAIDEGFIKSVDQSIGDFIDLTPYENAERLAEISIRDLLTMRAGLVWNSNDLSSEYHGLKNAKDPVAHVLSRKMPFAPGTTFNYSDGAAYLTSVVFTNATGKSLLEFGNEKLFAPLGIKKPVWNKDSSGNNYGGFDLFLTAQDMMKLGDMVLHRGEYDGVRIVSEDWILESTSHQAYSDGGSPDNNRYGYYWWLGEKDGLALVAAYGHGGQFIYVVEELGLVITAQCYGAVSDDLAAQHFVTLHQTIVHDVIPLFMD